MAVQKYKRLSRKKTIKLFFLKYSLRTIRLKIRQLCTFRHLLSSCINVRVCLRVSGRSPNPNLTFWFWGAKRTDRAELKLSPSSLIYRRWRKPVGKKRGGRRRRISLGGKEGKVQNRPKQHCARRNSPMRARSILYNLKKKITDL